MNLIKNCIESHGTIIIWKKKFTQLIRIISHLIISTKLYELEFNRSSSLPNPISFINLNKLNNLTDKTIGRFHLFRNLYLDFQKR